MEVSESLLKKITFNQQNLVNALAKKPEGMLSREITHKTGISNKSDIINKKFLALLAKEDLEIHIERISRQWLWILRKKK